jgi:ubiquinone/menaquinone biosynthesis C-methylase UbiE
LGAQVTGVDCAEKPLEYARKIAEFENRTCTFMQCVLPSLPFDDKNFDFVLLPDNIVEFSYQDMAELSKQVSRVLDEQGVFCLSFKPKDLPSELKVSHYTIPHKGTFEYHSYPWSVQHAKDIIGKHLFFVSAEEALDKEWWLTFKKSSVDKV